MTTKKPMGKRAIQAKREKLFSAELKLRGVQLYLLHMMGFAKLYGANDEERDRVAAFGYVTKALVEVLTEVESLG